jgi:hypothetical protein
LGVFWGEVLDKKTNIQLCEAQPDLSGALFLFSSKRKKRERKAEKAAQIISTKKPRL